MQIINLLVTLMIGLCCGAILIPVLTRFKFGQTVREDGPQAHVSKNGTPTMGGLIFIIPIIIMSLIVFKGDISQLYPMIALVLFAVIGGLDDILKIKRGKNLGLTSIQKIIGLFIVSAVLAVVGAKYFGTVVTMPLIGQSFDLGWTYVPFMILVYIGASNAVNLTDGLDGLSATVTIFVVLFLGMIQSALGMVETTVPIMNGIVIVALIAFLVFNYNPAKVFMGDTGSLSLGGMVVAMIVQMGTPFMLVIIGTVYVVETLSVIMQVIWFKKTGKRLFKMSPIHHHYELIGLKENQIVAMFSAITIIAGLIILLILR